MAEHAQRSFISLGVLRAWRCQLIPYSVAREVGDKDDPLSLAPLALYFNGMFLRFRFASPGFMLLLAFALLNQSLRLARGVKGGGAGSRT